MKRFDKFMRRSVSALLMCLVLTMTAVYTAQAQTTAFTYQGRFTDSSIVQPTNGTYTMTFRLYDAATNGNQIPDSSTAVTSMVSVVNNIFTTRLDFGAAAFNTTGARYLEIQVGSTFLTPRQEITSTPFSMRSLNAANADSLGGLAANQFVQTNDSRLTNARTPIAGSNNYVQNTTTQQSANFNVSGNGTVGGTLTTDRVVANGIRARGGEPGGFGALNNGYAFSSNGGDNDSGLFSTADGRVSLYVDSSERVRVEATTTTINGDLSATGTISGTLANNSVGSAQVTDGSLRLSDMAVSNYISNGVGGTFAPTSCLSFSLAAGSIPGLAANDIVTFIPPASSPAGFTFQPVYVTGTGAFLYNVCNTRNVNNTLPSQNYRIFVLRP